MFTIVSKRLISFRHSKTLLNLFFTTQANSFKNILNVPKFFPNARYKHLSKPGIPSESPPGSRYVPLSPIETAEQSILSTLKNKSSMSQEEWDNFKSDILDENQFISEESFSSIVMNVLLSSNQFHLGQSFLMYVEKSSMKPNFLTYLKYISLCSNNHRHVNQNHILQIIDKVKREIDASPVLDGKRAEYIIQGLCATNRWREAFEYLNKLMVGKPTRDMCNSLACAAIRNDDIALAYEILTKWLNFYDPINDKVIEEFLLVALNIQKDSCFESDKYLEKVFQFMKTRNVTISIDVAKLIEQYFTCHRSKWNISYTKVFRRGACQTCKNELKLLKLTNQEFENLREEFLKRAVMKSDLYINTNKAEFCNYMNFIDKHKPFHVVLDGLNAAYTLQGFHSRRNLAGQLQRVVKKLSGKSRNLLVLGKKHMKMWPGIQRVTERARLFFTDNISQDDPFVIYATLASGPHTVFLSGDLMRDHLSRLEDPRLIQLFKRWQLSHQIFVQSDTYNEISFIEPVRHSITVHGNMEDGWHIPIDDKIILDPYEELNNWLCIQRCI